MCLFVCVSGGDVYLFVFVCFFISGAFMCVLGCVCGCLGVRLCVWLFRCAFECVVV